MNKTRLFSRAAGALAGTLVVVGLAVTVLVSVPPGIQAQDDPSPYSRDAIAAGTQLYQTYCASCHGFNQSGEDHTNLIGVSLVNNTFVQTNSDAGLIEYIKVGRTADHPDNVSGIAMPGQGAILGDAQITQVVAYLRALNDPSLAEFIPVVVGGATVEVPDVPYHWVEVVDNLDSPIQVVSAHDGSGRLFALEQAGYVLVIEDGDYLPQPFLDITHLVPLPVYSGSYTEQGLLGLAFHPNYAENGLFFASYINRAGDSVISRFSVSADDPNRADLDSEMILFTVEQPFEDHNGGDLVFGPDGYLYVAFGDGGRPAEPNNRSQVPESFLGKMLRLDVDAAAPYAVPADNPFVDQPPFAPEIWALGLRNPWRFSFDRATGDLYIGDVGQWIFEEINFQPADSPGGENYGWSAYEANSPYLADSTLSGGTLTMPALEYAHDQGCSVTGGYVYRGEALPDLQGLYFYGDYCNGRIWTAQREDDVWSSQLFMLTDFVISSFGEDEAGELYLVDYKGAIYRLEALPPETTESG